MSTLIKYHFEDTYNKYNNFVTAYCLDINLDINFLGFFCV